MIEDATQTSSALPEEGLFPIRTVSSVTGVNPVTLRAWERRYKLIVPKRTPKGHRLYTREQIELIRRVVELLDRGISISQVKPLLEREEEAGDDTQHAETQVSADTWHPLLTRALDAIAAYDDDALDRLYEEVLSLYPVDAVTDRLSMSALDTVDTRCRTGEAGIAQQRFLKAYLRNRLGARFHHLKKGNHGPRLVVACVPGEHDETSPLLLGLSASVQGYRTVYLGGDVPFEELPAVVERTRASAVVLTATTKPRGRIFTELLPDLVSQLRTPVLLGGRIVYTHEKQIGASGATSIGTLSSAAEINHAIRLIGENLVP